MEFKIVGYDADLDSDCLQTNYAFLSFQRYSTVTDVLKKYLWLKSPLLIIKIEVFSVKGSQSKFYLHDLKLGFCETERIFHCLAR